MKIPGQIKKIIELAIEEDVGTGDITTSLVLDKKLHGTASIIAKEKGIICGTDVAKYVCYCIDKKLKFTALCNDGDFVNPSQKIAKISGPFNSLLTAERTMLNFLQRMSGIATTTHKYISLLEGTGVTLLDTRKTVPGHRLLDKYAVKTGGAANHRIGLFDMILIKDNHIEAAGGITAAVKRAAANKPPKMKIEIEASTINDVKEALKNNADIIMLDNMSPGDMKKAVKLINRRCKTEASGGMTINKIRRAAKTGVDYISTGSLTHSVKALDIAMYIKLGKK